MSSTRSTTRACCRAAPRPCTNGAAGTAHTSLAAGPPTLICSVVADQPFWGAQCRRLGVGETFPFAKLDAKRLTGSLRVVLDDRVAARARDVSERMAEEDGISAAVAHLEQGRAGRSAHPIRSSWLIWPSLPRRGHASGAPLRRLQMMLVSVGDQFAKAHECVEGRLATAAEPLALEPSSAPNHRVRLFGPHIARWRGVDHYTLVACSAHARVGRCGHGPISGSGGHRAVGVDMSCVVATRWSNSDDELLEPGA
jgi:hypothetical protein